MSETDSPLAADEVLLSAVLITEPPSESIADSKDSRVLVEGSKNIVERILCLHFSLKSSGFLSIWSALFIRASISEVVKSRMLTTLRGFVVIYSSVNI